MIKRLTYEHMEDVKKLFLSVFTQPPWHDHWPSDAYVTRYLDDLMNQQNSLSLGYYHQDELVGLSLGYTFHWWQGKDYFIKEFCIKRDLQGQGIGSSFLHEMENELLSLGIEAMYLITERDVPAYHFYQKNDFFELKNSVMFAKNMKQKD